jgi:hypothetical protein
LKCSESQQQALQNGNLLPTLGCKQRIWVEGLLLTREVVAGICKAGAMHNFFLKGSLPNFALSMIHTDHQCLNYSKSGSSSLLTYSKQRADLQFHKAQQWP